MSHPSLADFFRPDLGASNRALKKYLEDEGLTLGFRDLVSLRGAAEAGIFFRALEGSLERAVSLFPCKAHKGQVG